MGPGSLPLRTRPCHVRFRGNLCAAHPKVACNSTDHIFLISQKHWNHNETISIPKRLIGKLHATLLGNQDDAPYKIRPRPGLVVRLCTRYGAVHPLRDCAPDQKGCNAYGSGALPHPQQAHMRTSRMEVDGPDRCRTQGRQGQAGHRDAPPSGQLAARQSRGIEPGRGTHTRRGRGQPRNRAQPNPGLVIDNQTRRSTIRFANASSAVFASPLGSGASAATASSAQVRAS